MLGPSWSYLKALLAISRSVLGHVGAIGGHSFALQMTISLETSIKHEKMTMNSLTRFDIFLSRGHLEPIVAIFGHRGATSSSFDALPLERASRSNAKTGLS